MTELSKKTVEGLEEILDESDPGTKQHRYAKQALGSIRALNELVGDGEE